MNIDGKIERKANLNHQQTGDPYVRLILKGRTFLSFDEEVITKCAKFEVQEYVRLEYTFGAKAWGPNVYTLLDIMAD